MNKKNISRFFLVVAVFLFVFLFNKQVFISADNNISADSKIKINLDGENFYGIKRNDKILIPIRRVFEELNCLVCFNKNREISLWNNKTYPVSLKVGEQKISLGEETRTLNSPVEIIDDNSFVELDFINHTKDIFGASYEIKDDLVTINKKPGQFKVYSYHFCQEIKSDSGELKGTIAYCLPVVEPEVNSAFIAKINTDYDKIFDDFVADAQKQINSDEENLYPKEYYIYFDVSYNKNDLLSILVSGYECTEGFLPDTMRVSKTFDLKNNKELDLKDILNIDYDYEKTVYDVSEKILNGEFANLPDDQKAKILELFSKSIESADLNLSDPTVSDYVKKEFRNVFEKLINGEYKFSDEQRNEILKSISEMMKSIDFYLTNDALVLYLNNYGDTYPSTDLKYDSNKDLFKINLAQ